MDRHVSIVNEKCCLPHQQIKEFTAIKSSHYSCPDSEPCRNSGRRHMVCPLPSPQPLQHPLSQLHMLRGFRMEKSRILAPDN